MPLTNSAIRRYTPPTCTLEVLAQNSPLSRWTGKSVLKNLTFELRFDDPRLPEDKRIPIRGDRDQLEALCSAVANYVQEFLQKSPESFWETFWGSNEPSKASDELEIKEFTRSSIKTKTLNSFNAQIPGAEIYLEPSSHLTHNLFLGSLANQASGPVIKLSVLQLFDLASALDEYCADVMALPTDANISRSRPTFALPTWAPVAAVLVIGLGLTPITWQYANRIKQEDEKAAKTVKPNQSDQEIAQQPSFSSSLPTPQPALTPPDSLPSQPIPGSTPPAIPNAASLPISPTSPGVIATTPQKPGTPTSPSVSQTSPNLNFPSTSLPSTSSTLNIPSGTRTTPTFPTASPKKNAPSTLTAAPQIAIQPNLSQSSRTGSKIRNSGTTFPSTTSNLPSSAFPSGSISPSISSAPPPLAAIPNASSGDRTSVLSPADSSSLANLSDEGNLASRLRESRNNSTEVATNSRSNTGSDTLFDSTPQIAEARDILSKRWNPPQGLKQTLEYSLTVGIDGRIERILPLGKAARDYVDSAMPSVGQPFVSPNRNGQNVRIRAVLSPNGKVQTFPEND
ncbi:MAG: DUF4335 domain-containing protein [Heteroscytonema crispum UTEX LB 1556]